MIVIIFLTTFIGLFLFLIIGFIRYLIKHISHLRNEKKPKLSNIQFNDSLIELVKEVNKIIPPSEPVEKKVCERCGTLVLMDAKKCPYCETKL